MAAKSFTPAQVVDMNKEKEWASSLGMLDWDKTSIVFTKRTLIEFLRYTGTTVDPNFTNISKLPKYATFGKIADAPAGTSTEAIAETSEEPAAAPVAAASTSPEQPATTGVRGFIPSRRVRTAPGGESHMNEIFGGSIDEEVQPPAHATSRVAPPQAPEQTFPDRTHGRNESVVEEKRGFVPTRRVREQPGGRDSISDILSFN
ncbi:hypothetical protein BDW22DRAFT_1360725 [Trametopsis cervina]|nr:hypothetical protein BDW22DRAFT_1360725 [Trametopsis cervina]